MISTSAETANLAETLPFSPIMIRNYTRNPDHDRRFGRNFVIFPDHDPKLHWNHRSWSRDLQNSVATSLNTLFNSFLLDFSHISLHLFISHSSPHPKSSNPLAFPSKISPNLLIFLLPHCIFCIKPENFWVFPQETLEGKGWRTLAGISTKLFTLLVS